MSGAGDRGPVAPVAGLLLAIFGVLAFAGFLASLARPPSNPGADGRAHALSRSAVGYAGLVELLRAGGRTVRVTRGEPNHQGLLVLTPPADVGAEAIGRLTSKGAVLLVAPKWRTIKDDRHRGWVRALSASPFPAALLLRDLGLRGPQTQSNLDGGSSELRLIASADTREDTLFSGAFERPIDAGAVDKLVTVASPTLRPMLTDERGRTVLAKLANREVYVLSEPDLLNDRGLKSLDTARVATAIIDALREGGPVSFDVSLNGFGRDRNALRLAFEPPFAAATACLVLAAALAGLHGLARFGPPLRPERAYALGKRALIDSAASLLAVNRREPRLAGAYAALVRAETARRLGLRDAEGADAPAFDALVARRGAAPWATLGDWAVRVRTGSELVGYAGALQDWMTEVTGGR